MKSYRSCETANKYSLNEKNQYHPRPAISNQTLCQESAGPIFFMRWTLNSDVFHRHSLHILRYSNCLYMPLRWSLWLHTTSLQQPHPRARPDLAFRFRNNPIRRSIKLQSHVLKEFFLRMGFGRPAMKSVNCGAEFISGLSSLSECIRFCRVKSLFCCQIKQPLVFVFIVSVSFFQSYSFIFDKILAPK